MMGVDEGAWRLMKVSRAIDSKTRAANRECANERSACANSSDGEP
jgi:hypothetical protein